MAKAKVYFISILLIYIHFVLINGAACKFLEDQPETGDVYEDFENVYNFPTPENTPPPRKKYSFVKKWQVGRVSRKQYEIINMLWRRSNTNTDSTTPYAPTAPLKEQKSVFTYPRNIFSVSPQSYPYAQYVHKSSTPSYIEFYYLDEVETIDGQHTAHSTTKQKRDRDITRPKFDEDRSRYIFRPPHFAFHINEPIYKKTVSHYFLDGVFPTQETKTDDTNVIKAYKQANIQNKPSASTMNVKTINKLSPEVATLTAIKLTTRTITTTTTTSSTTVSRTTDTTTASPPTKSVTTSTVSPKTIPTSDRTLSETISKLTQRTFHTAKKPVTKYLKETTLYDKIKFFEVYDSLTRSWLNRDINDIDNINTNNTVKLTLENVYDSLGENFHSNLKFAKKDVGKIQNEIKNNCTLSYNECLNKEFSESNLKDAVSKKLQELNSTVNGNPTSFGIKTVSEKIKWIEYPYIAVYFYERLQVHCDAVIFSTHWLLASAACLSRHREDPPGDERTAFVTYCSDNWWEPDHINYVKQLLIHPKYNHKDVSRRHLYNIGVIQVVSSMSMNCHGYAPIPVMSHDYIAEPGGSLAVAVGFGLDRYATSYSANDLPRRPLSKYESIIFSNTCPGNTFYRKMKNKYKERDSVYCLSLPPYLGEENDPIHGGILLAEGKLIGLYLQEERRRSGVQSAQYTSVWRLFPWVVEVAREPAEPDFCISDEGVR